MHCHVEFHSEMGMALIFKVGNEALLPQAPENWPQCGNFAAKTKSEISGANRNLFSFMLYNILFVCFYLIQ
jgi:L-ascorbate oxidase